jgi:hypothetical protein
MDIKNNYFVSLVISLLYLLIKTGEQKFVTKEILPIKELIKDSLIIFISSCLALNIIENINSAEVTEQTQIFTGTPEF